MGTACSKAALFDECLADAPALQRRWNLSRAQLDAGVKAACRDLSWSDLRRFTSDPGTARGLLLLCAKAPPANMHPCLRVPTLQMVARSRPHLDVLRRLANPAGAPGVRPQTFAQFAARDGMGAWASHVLPAKLVQRVQTSGGPCSYHAAITVAHYAVCRAADRPTLDYEAYVARCGDAWKAVVEKPGGSSVRCLERLTAQGIVDHMTVDLTDAQITDNLGRYGPALVSMFQLWDGFTAGAGPSFTGAVTAPASGAHAMALVGWRRAPDGSCLYLLQNWWPDMQFVECDRLLLVSRFGRLCWVETPVAGWPPGFPVVADDGQVGQHVDGPDKVEEKFERDLAAIYCDEGRCRACEEEAAERAAFHA